MGTLSLKSWEKDKRVFAFLGDNEPS
jgi:hypothetical protein